MKHKVERLKEGLVQVYTGSGKGKTSAALGLALRALGRGLRVYIIQFIKGGFDYGELYAARRMKNLQLKAFGKGRFVTHTPPRSEDVNAAEEAFEFAKAVILGGEYDIVILDEINIALNLELLTINSVLELITEKPNHVELVLTGRCAPSKIIDVADLVTEMVEIKHPLKKGVHPRKGIEF